jgi:hypothetical protein
MRDTSKRFGWKALTYGAGALSAVVTQRVLGVVWKRVGGQAPPDDLANRQMGLTPALTWAVATGVGIGVTRLIALRSAARVWEAATHEKPPDVE